MRRFYHNLPPDDDLADYCVIGPDKNARLSSVERATLTGGRELDRAISMLARQAGSFTMEGELSEIDGLSLDAAAKFYGSPEFQRDPGRFFVAPDTAPEVAEVVIHGLRDGEIVDLSFASRYQVQHPEIRSAYLACAENQTVHARYWRHKQGATATVVAIHGWTMGDQRVNSLAFLPGLFYRLGLDVILMELPFHGRRKGSPATSLFPGPNVMHTNEAVGQIIHDLRSLSLMLQARGVARVGVMGMSLGAYIGALWASLEPLEFCVPIVPLVSMAEMAWELVTKNPASVQGIVTRELIDQALWLHCPLSHKPIIKPGQVLIIAGIGDEIVPSRQPKLLWDHWRRPAIQWLVGGHQAIFQRERAFRRLITFLTDRGLTNQAIDTAP